MNRSIALVAIVSMMTSGCSFLLVRGPQDVGTPPRAYPVCTDSMTWPAVDGALALLFGIGMFSALNQSDQEYTTGNPDRDAADQRTEAMVSLGILTAAAGVSAFVGYQRVNRCGTAREEFAKAYPQGQGLPTWGAPQGYPATYPQQGYPQPYPPQPYAPQPGYPQPQPYAPPTQPNAPQPYAPQPYPPQPYAPPPQPYPTQPNVPQRDAPQSAPQGSPTQPQKRAGYEGGACMTQSACNRGLVCASGYCVRPPSSTTTNP